MIGIAEQKLWNLGAGLLSKWNDLTYAIYILLKNINVAIPHKLKFVP